MSRDNTPCEPSPDNARSQAVAAAELQDVGARLLRLKPEQLAGIPLADDLREAVVEAQRLEPRTEARRRQIQFIGKLMRNDGVDAVAIARLIDDIDSGAHADRLERRAQRWRERLLAEGDGGLSALVTECPNAERQRLRQLIRKASKIAPGTPAREQAERELAAALRGTLGRP